MTNLIKKVKHRMQAGFPFSDFQNLIQSWLIQRNLNFPDKDAREIILEKGFKEWPWLFNVVSDTNHKKILRLLEKIGPDLFDNLSFIIKICSKHNNTIFIPRLTINEWGKNLKCFKAYLRSLDQSFYMQTGYPSHYYHPSLWFFRHLSTTLPTKPTEGVYLGTGDENLVTTGDELFSQSKYQLFSEHLSREYGYPVKSEEYIKLLYSWGKETIELARYDSSEWLRTDDEKVKKQLEKGEDDLIELTYVEDERKYEDTIEYSFIPSNKIDLLLRETLIDLKIKVIDHCIHAIENENATQLWDACKKDILDRFTTDELKELIHFELLLNNHRPFYTHGGFLSLFLLIGILKKEFELGYMNLFKSVQIDNKATDPFHFLSVIEDHLDELLEENNKMISLRKKEHYFWEQWSHAIQKDLHIDFGYDLSSLDNYLYVLDYVNVLDRYIEQCIQIESTSELIENVISKHRMSDDNAYLDKKSFFIRKGDRWSIRFNGGDSFEINNSRGFEEIQYLLCYSSCENAHINPFDFPSELLSLSNNTNLNHAQNSEWKNQSKSGDIERIDEKAFENYCQRIENLKEERETCQDEYKRDKIEEEIELIEKEIRKNTFQNRLKKIPNNEIRRCYNRINSRIKGAIKKIRNYDNDLAKHLNKYITSKSRYFVYDITPEEKKKVGWFFK